MLCYVPFLFLFFKYVLFVNKGRDLHLRGCISVKIWTLTHHQAIPIQRNLMQPSISRTPDFSNQFLIAFPLEVREIEIPLYCFLLSISLCHILATLPYRKSDLVRCRFCDSCFLGKRGQSVSVYLSLHFLVSSLCTATPPLKQKSFFLGEGRLYTGYLVSCWIFYSFIYLLVSFIFMVGVMTQRFLLRCSSRTPTSFKYALQI